MGRDNIRQTCSVCDTKYYNDVDGYKVYEWI